MSIKHVFLVSGMLFMVSGCASFRGMPSHGGGKRFDEEQRLVAASTYKSLEQMDVHELKGKTVRIVSEFTTTYGSGNANFGGLQDIGLSASYQDSSDDYSGAFNSRTAETRRAATFGTNFRYRPDMTFYSGTANTDRDAAYFISCMEMTLRHAGVIIAPKGEEVTLYVLLDILGTNLSRKDRFFNHTDFLNASCEFTYYAVDNSTGNILFESRRCGAVAHYIEKIWLFAGTDDIQRSIEATIPLEMPAFYAVPVEKPVAKAAPTPAPVAPAAKAAPAPAAKPAPAPTPKPAAQTTPKPTPATAPAPAAKAAPTPTPAPKPAAAPTSTPTVAPTPAKPVAQAVAKPAAKPVTEAERKEKQLQELADQARQLLESGQSNQIPGVIQQIRSIDPTADVLKEIAVLQGNGKF
ncbi:MAG: hypothetical protein K9M54_01240 [Kiritimatiellales bacterium]|nr:hypothetical protein [Kiritimatiellales bacterium]MCF7863216.1 hypothetical protein [Kiritimatiellales bacterium]